MRGRRRRTIVAAALAAWALAVAACGGGSGGGGEPALPAEARLGERLFRETRFAHFFSTRVDGRALDDPLPGGDPVVDEVETTGDPLPGPYAGLAISCAACHLSDELAAVAGGVRAHCDFARRSPLPARDDGLEETVRNAPALLDAASPRTAAAFFHYDGEFGSLEDLALATLLGRSLGWKPLERATAAAHVARVLREDDGADENALRHGGGAYRDLLAGAVGLAPDGATLPDAFRLDVLAATDEEAAAAAARLLAVYVASLARATDGEAVRTFRSPYDAFLARNGLPDAPDPGESNVAYGRRLRAAVTALADPKDVGPGDGDLRTHAHPFRFAAAERRGLLVFLAEPGDAGPGQVGSCVSCHAPPVFSDFGFHNVGASQVEYDDVHGLGAFLALDVPSLAERDADPDRFLLPSALRPDARGELRSAPREDDPSLADLGLWNVFANPDLPGPQAALRAAVALRLGVPEATSDADLLPATLGWMRTPSLRDLGHSAPYFHGGHADELEDAVQHYRAAGLSARFGLVRNAAPEIAGIDLDVQPLFDLAAFLRSLDEDPR
jgi:cytochrome c peroxidase